MNNSNHPESSLPKTAMQPPKKEVLTTACIPSHIAQRDNQQKGGAA